LHTYAGITFSKQPLCGCAAVIPPHASFGFFQKQRLMTCMCVQTDGGNMGPDWQLGRFMSDGKPMLAVQQLLIKGLFKPETELTTVQVG
jgi:hypothetical protein